MLPEHESTAQTHDLVSTSYGPAIQHQRDDGREPPAADRRTQPHGQTDFPAKIHDHAHSRSNPINWSRLHRPCLMMPHPDCNGHRPMVHMINGQAPSPSAYWPDRADARRRDITRYRPDEPCAAHPDSLFWTANDECVACWQARQRVTPTAPDFSSRNKV